MRRLRVVVGAAGLLGLAAGFALPTVAQVIGPPPGEPVGPIAVNCPGCKPDNLGIVATCNQCGGQIKSVGTNCDVCCASNTQCDRQEAPSARSAGSERAF